MAVIIGYPGESARKTWFVDLFATPVIALVVVLLISPIFVFAFSRGNPACVVLEIVVVSAICLYIWRDDYREMIAAMRGATNWAKGADGEARAGAALASLPDSYIVFHDFNPVVGGAVAKWNVDHIVIGPNGMFVVETKNYSQSRVTPASKNSFTRRNVAQTRRNSLMFKDKIKVWSAGVLGDVFVVPILVYTQESAFIENTNEGDVRVIPLKWLATQIANHKTRRELNPDEAYRIANVMFQQMEPYQMDAYRAELDRYGTESRRFKLERAKARSSSSDSDNSPENSTQPGAEQSELSVDPSGTDIPAACPNCGGVLVERIARKGPRAGKRFLGCANYQSKGCKFLVNLED